VCNSLRGVTSKRTWFFAKLQTSEHKAVTRMFAPPTVRLESQVMIGAAIRRQECLCSVWRRVSVAAMDVIGV
jgi:hypothetical protein